MAVRDDNLLLSAQAALTGRDLRLLDWLYDHGALTTGQIAAALFPSLGFCQRRLLKLVHLRVLARFRPQRWEGGTYPYHYVLDQLGAEIVAAQRGDQPPRRDQARRRRHHLTSRANLPHLLATNQFFIDLAAHGRSHPGSHLTRWLPGSAFYEKGAFFHAGDNPAVMLHRNIPRPDGHGVWEDNDVRIPFLLEMDLATEALTVLLDKVGGYDTLARLTQWRWPVLFHLPSARREVNLQNVIASAGFHRPIVATTNAEYAVGRSPAESIWWMHGRQGERLRLADLPYTDPEQALGLDPDAVDQ
jgi:protein involved in plasmid replication-relaxation